MGAGAVSLRADGGVDTWDGVGAGFPTGTVLLHAETGETVAIDAAPWHRPATAEERALLAGVDGPVIDLGCGPGRLVATLAPRRVACLGVDSSWSAVGLARRRGAVVVHRDIFDPLPGEGCWATALLFDGNIGIGGDPVRLLTRCRRLLVPGGLVVAEVEDPGGGWRCLRGRFEHQGGTGPRVAWAVVAADAVGELAAAAGLGVSNVVRTPSGRWFASLRARP